MTEAPGLQAERTTLARVRTALTTAVTALIVARAVRDHPPLVAIAVLCAALPMVSVVFSTRTHSRLVDGMDRDVLPGAVRRLVVLPVVVVLLAVVTALGL
ncbi:DUF202 domain-containing protein [Rhodococcus sp. BP-349]|uniref:DUF202 domain-containing protein n=1 Tax=unclassified Rhodococcus (in: high G+C Gram-positive bacteria) TaxID=192944 RepID=UPI001C9B2536|nr:MULTISPECIES: DUF202 domain-containing protein [unclassified Rhodococcus (in: high G+C Gram-positive bacteria)]MBY6537127.1 DUF202 domain-containing protein [Rhodococcus sp. BP-363]MBY6541464.1 DUF202 domain-containing protein [Rhodococcus sp. BP-369]MBY6560694.1 DUF202 domain-containing protein [Rhodococcus sp. BP-370]MBY6574986.1 DUF202 domain-containing protein [Rhodococcus sp. BP-364]MBY6584287.1 DUF202 domain-containing protein [Rhodococcus sp. BP-358]